MRRAFASLIATSFSLAGTIKQLAEIFNRASKSREEKGRRRERRREDKERKARWQFFLLSLPSAFPLTEQGFPHIIQTKETNMFGSLGIWEILLIVVVIALLFGGRKLPELGKGLGQGIKNFKNAVKGVDKDEEKSKDEKGN
jgi:sec-independent protein translocase protein TatA